MFVLVVDTNVFLQCSDLSNLNWSRVTDGQDALVLIPRAVQQEIDRLKQSGNSRRAKRARKASSFFREIIDSDDLTLTIREEDPRVEVSFSRRIDLNHQVPQSLDLSHADDRIVGEALAYRIAHPGADVRLLTADTNIMLTARECALPYLPVPDEWFLPPEPDEREKAVAELRRRIEVLERTSPAIGIFTVDQGGGPLTRVEMSVETYRQLSPIEIDELVNELQKKHPIKENFSGRASPVVSPHLLRQEISHFARLGGFGGYVPPSEAEIAKYKNEEYPNWLKAVREVFRGLHEGLEAPSRQVAITFLLKNDGAQPAQNARVEFRALGGLLIAPPARSNGNGDNQDVLGQLDKQALPRPPQPPAGRQGDPVPGWFAHEGRLTTPLLPDIGWHEIERHEFYWTEGRPIKSVFNWTLTCVEFRHKAEPKSFELVVRVPRLPAMSKAAIECRVSASNLPEPASMTLPVVITYLSAKTDTIQVARNLIHAS